MKKHKNVSLEISRQDFLKALKRMQSIHIDLLIVAALQLVLILTSMFG